MAGAPPAIPVPAVVVPAFALAPALAGGGAPIDYTTRAGQAMYSQATEKLPYLFRGKESSLPTFLQALRDRADAAGWEDIFTITIGADGAGNAINRNLLTQYGEITLTNVRDNAAADYIGQQVRNAQISHQIYQCIRKSITDEVSERLVTESENFYVQGVPDGPAFLMTLINIYFVKTNATPTTLRLKIAEAHILIVEHEYDIDKFNTELNGYIQKLAANGEETQDLFAHLTKAYKLVPDKSFQAYIRTKIDTHNDGTVTITTLQLMEFAKQKYDELVEEHTWMHKDETEQKLLALTAQLHQMEAKATKQEQKGKSIRDKNKKGKQKGKRNKKEEDKWAWKDVKPKSNQAQTKEFQGKTYHWCQFHKKWTLHKPADCRLNPEAEANANPKRHQETNPTDASPAAAIGLEAILHQAPFYDE